MTENEESGFIVRKEVIFTSSCGNEVTKVSCKDGSVWFMSTSLGLIGNDIGNELREDSDGHILNERDEFIDINDERLYCWYGDIALEMEIKELSMQD